MRKIKFRLWDKEKKIMLNVRSIDFEDCYFDTGGMYIDTIEGLDYWDSELYSLMQYTGLHDKNGDEIYEGDIVYVIPEDEGAIIKWDNESAKFAIKFDGYIADFDCYFGKDLEVIGNIYENKELLNETD